MELLTFLFLLLWTICTTVGIVIADSFVFLSFLALDLSPCNASSTFVDRVSFNIATKKRSAFYFFISVKVSRIIVGFALTVIRAIKIFMYDTPEFFFLPNIYVSTNLFHILYSICCWHHPFFLTQLAAS